MHYLKCNNCGELNALKSEMMTFCSVCGYKMDNSFSVWAFYNPLKTFEEYKNEVCISDVPINPTNKNLVKIKPNNWKLVIIIAVSLIVLFLIGFFLAKAFVAKSGMGTPDAVYSQKWERSIYGTLGLSINSPVKLKEGYLPLSEDYLQYISLMETYEYNTWKGLNIILNSVEYEKSIGEVNLDGAAEGSMNEISNQNGITELQYYQISIELNSIPGFMQEGSYNQDGNVVEFINIGYGSGVNLWQVMVKFPKGDINGKKVADKIIESIEIDAPEKNIEDEEEKIEDKGIVI